MKLAEIRARLNGVNQVTLTPPPYLLLSRFDIENLLAVAEAAKAWRSSGREDHLCDALDTLEVA